MSTAYRVNFVFSQFWFLFSYWHIINWYSLFINSSVMALCYKAVLHWSVSPVDSPKDHHLCVCSEARRYRWLCWRAAVLKRIRMMWELPWRLLFHYDSKDNHTLCNWTDLLTVCSCWPFHINFLPLCPPGRGNGSTWAFYLYYVDHIWNC